MTIAFSADVFMTGDRVATAAMAETVEARCIRPRTQWSIS